MPAYAVNQSAGVATLRFTKGKAFRQPFVMTRRPSGIPFDLTGFTFTMVATLFNAGQVVDEFEVAVEDAERGRLVATLTADKSDAFDTGTYWWELEGTAPDGVTYPLAEGPLEVMNRGRRP